MIKQKKIQETLLRLCKHYGEQNWWQSDNKIEDLVSTILIQRTTEKNAKLALAGLMDVMIQLSMIIRLNLSCPMVKLSHIIIRLKKR